ncbi:MAG: tyrosine-protein phosphatase [Candidatus Nanopelagicales bacterium]
MSAQPSVPGWAPTRIDLASVPNLRDVGGASACGGRTVRPRTLFRSTQLAGVVDTDRAALEALELAMVVDLRTAREVELAPDVRITDKYLWLDVLRDFAPASQVGVEDLFADPQQFESILRDGTAEAMMTQAYLALVDLPSARQSYGRWLQDLADSSGSVLVHCTNGKDRTGWAVALALLTIGVDEADVYTDYLATNDQLLPAMREVLEGAQRRGIDPELFLPVIGVREQYLASALERVGELGGMDAYLALMGISEKLVGDLVDRLTTD